MDRMRKAFAVWREALGNEDRLWACAEPNARVACEANLEGRLL
jgi:hypothetical protein